MNYKPSDTMNLVHEVKKLGWHFTYSKENISINRHDVTLSLYREVDPEAWREEYRKKQAAGVKFERLCCDGEWEGAEANGGPFNFTLEKEDYREVPQEVQKECDMRIPEASREVLKQWQAKGLKFKVIGMTARFALEFTDKTASNYTIPKQPMPEGMSVEMVEAMWQQGLKVEFDEIYGGQGWTEIGDTFTWSGNRATFKGAELLKRLRIPAQPIPEKLLEVPQDVSASECQKKALEHLAKTYSADKGTAQLNPTIPPHAAERALWKAQREAGTNEVWQEILPSGTIMDIVGPPAWAPRCTYRVKPMKLTARICMVGKAYPMSYIGQDWEFTGTREEYRAECEKYGYAILSEIKEVKPKTVKYYFALCVCKSRTFSISGLTAEGIQRRAKNGVFTIIGDIEEREVEV